MPSVLAIVAKAAFEPLDKQHGPIAPGKVLPLTEYLSQNRALSGLAEGGSILLVTVRPPGERLWLLAVLEEPRSDGTKWSAAANAVPVRDVTDLIPRLRFSTGKGISAKPGALGMSLQTPRTLTDEDEALLRGTTGGVAAPEAGATVRE